MPQITNQNQKKPPTFALPAPPSRVKMPQDLPVGKPLARMGLGALDLNEYPEVLMFQHDFNAIWVNSQALPADRRITGSRIDEDGKYASETDGALRRLINFLVREGSCTGTSSSEVRNGPNGVAGCLQAVGMTAANVAVMQQAWREWKVAQGVTPPTTGGGDGGGGTPTDGGGSGDGGGGTPSGGGTYPRVTKAGWWGGLLLAFDALGGALLAVSSKKWK